MSQAHLPHNRICALTVSKLQAGDTIPRQMVPGCIRELAKHEPGRANEQYSSIVCFRLRLGVLP